MASPRKFRNDWPIPEEYMLELGRLTCVWAALETQLNLFLGKLSGFNDLNNMTPFILITHASFPQRLDMLGALCEYLCPSHPSLSGHAEVVAKMRAAQSSRNRFVHNGITPDETGTRFMLIQGSARGRLKTNINPVEPKDIRTATAQVNEAAGALYKLVLGKEIPEAGRVEQDSGS
jgi:hypothetical protein